MSLQLTTQSSGLTNVRVSVHNDGNTDCTFRRAVHNDQTGVLRYNALKVQDAEGKEVPYIGPLIHGRFNYVCLPSGATLQFEADISKNYQLHPEQAYRVAFATACEETSYKVFISNEAKIVAQRTEAEISQKRANGDYEDAEIEAMPSIKDGNYKFFDITDPDLIAQTVEAADAAAAVLQQLKNSDRKTFARYYHDFICSASEAPAGDVFLDEVQKNFADSADFLNKVTFAGKGTQCDPTDYAYVYPQHRSYGHVVRLCDQYGRSQALPDTAKPYDSKMGTIVHEVLHKVNRAVVDNYYGSHKCATRLRTTSCVDTQNTLTSLGRTNLSQKEWDAEQAKQKKLLNLNMYTADCSEFLAEDRYTKDHAPATNGWLKSTSSTVAAGLVGMVLGAGGLMIYRHLANNRMAPPRLHHD